MQRKRKKQEIHCIKNTTKVSKNTIFVANYTKKSIFIYISSTIIVIIYQILFDITSLHLHSKIQLNNSYITSLSVIKITLLKNSNTTDNTAS